MSDEREGAGAVVAQPLRPSGKRSRRGAVADRGDTDSTTETKAAVTKDGAGTGVKTARKAAKPPRPNPILFVIDYLREVIAELRKVIWPNRKQMVTYTSVVLVFLAFMVTLISLVDLGFARVVMMVFGD